MDGGYSPPLQFAAREVVVATSSPTDTASQCMGHAFRPVKFQRLTRAWGQRLVPAARERGSASGSVPCASEMTDAASVVVEEEETDESLEKIDNDDVKEEIRVEKEVEHKHLRELGVYGMADAGFYRPTSYHFVTLRRHRKSS
ncbi:hypothetical protein R1flu_024602 [Riccia fluitans]|uniref:Uncharacterized protein n=1 Tax=Riccia fluitans TaxID=41844 RepID=A0ABD1XVS1_9MARC